MVSNLEIEVRWKLKGEVLLTKYGIWSLSHTYESLSQTINASESSISTNNRLDDDSIMEGVVQFYHDDNPIFLEIDRDSPKEEFWYMLDHYMVTDPSYLRKSRFEVYIKGENAYGVGVARWAFLIVV